MEYTKGQWQRNKFKIECDGAEIATLPAPHYIYRKPECDANANLIVSAPLLYEALKYIIRELDKADIIKDNSIFMEMPQRAIKKAEGK
jgi:hypothetical protein